MPTFPFNEKYLSQLPALQQLINLGYQYLPPAQAMTERGGRASNVLLENILRDQLKKINRIRYKGGEYLFSEENIQSAIQKSKPSNTTACKKQAKQSTTCSPLARRLNKRLKAIPKVLR